MHHQTSAEPSPASQETWRNGICSKSTPINWRLGRRLEDALSGFVRPVEARHRREGIACPAEVSQARASGIRLRGKFRVGAVVLREPIT